MSTPNTRTQPYLSVFNTSGDCKSSKEAIDTKCKKKGKGEEKPNTWLTENCKGLMDKPTGPNIAAIGKYFKNVDKMTPGPAPNTMASAATYQEGLANSNPCIQARRCKLVPFKETSPASTAKEGGLGCCPGQTGHHLLPEEMFADCNDEKDDSNRYDSGVHNDGPTVCAEGANNTHGSHGKIHIEMDRQMTDYLKSAKADSISHTDAIDRASESLNKTFPGAGCNPECTKQQLQSYYKDFCVGKVKPRGGLGDKGTSKTAARNLVEKLKVGVKK
jgi:hypothetical protein